MKVLTVRQPWAAAFFVAPNIAKDIENRTWAPGTVGRIAIHAGLTVDEDALLTVGTPRILDKSVGVILGTVEITSYHRAGVPGGCSSMFCDANPWAMFDEDGRIWHWMIEHARRFVTPIPARGNLGLWEPGPSVAHLIEIAEVVE